MLVQAQPTPNPNAMKFVVEGAYFAKPLSFPSAEAAARHPLAVRLFALDGVYNVFMVQDFITVNKHPELAWAALVTQIEQIIVNYMSLQATSNEKGRA